MHAQYAGPAGGFDEAADLGHRFLMCPHAVFWAALTWTKAGWRRLRFRKTVVLDGDRKKMALSSLRYLFSIAPGTMKLNQFRDVVAIAERGSLRAAARHLQLAQPALT